jgi:HD-like signal output (HDOD) protein
MTFSSLTTEISRPENDREASHRSREIMIVIQQRPQELIFSTLDSIGDVPTLPPIAMKAIEISNDDNSSARELANFIGQDQALTTRLLKITNATIFGLSGRVATVDRAIVILGFTKVRTIVLAASVSEMFYGDSECLDRPRLWRHSIATATAAKMLAKGEYGVDCSMAYVAGLLHEIGVVILDRYFHDTLRSAVQMAHVQQTTIDKTLRDLIGMDQFKIGSYLAERWRLPGALCSAIGCHNAPPIANGNAQVIAIVHVASRIADVCKLNYEPHAASRPISANAVQLLGLTSDRIKAAAEELNRQRSCIDEFASLCAA